MSDIGISAVGSYIPRLRLSRKKIAESHRWAIPGLQGLGKGGKAFCDYDEDCLTMAVAAAGSLCDADPANNNTGSLVLASTTLPFVDRQNATLVAEALGLPDTLQTADVTGSQRAATSALIQALQGGREGLVIAAEKRHCQPGSVLEMTAADGSAAVKIGQDNLIAKYLGSSSLSRDLVDHYRTAETEFNYSLEERWVREQGLLEMIPQAVKQLLQQCQLDGESIDRIIIPVNAMRTAQLVAKHCGIDPACAQDNLQVNCGDTGCAQPLLMLNSALEEAAAGERILLVGFGQGCDALLFETTEAITGYRSGNPVSEELSKGVEDDNYLRYLSFNNLLKMDWGIRAERDMRTAHSAHYRKRATITSFMGGKCTACSTIQFPKTDLCVNPDCNQLNTQVDEPFRNKVGKVKSFTEDWLAHSVSPPLMFGSVRFEGKGALTMQFAGYNPGELSVGDSVKMAFRIKDRDELRGVHRYFWKAIPAGKLD